MYRSSPVCSFAMTMQMVNLLSMDTALPHLFPVTLTEDTSSSLLSGEIAYAQLPKGQERPHLQPPLR